MESLRSFKGFPSSSKWKSIVMLPSVSWADSKFVTLRVGRPSARNTDRRERIYLCTEYKLKKINK